MYLPYIHLANGSYYTNLVYSKKTYVEHAVWHYYSFVTCDQCVTVMSL